MSTSVPRIEISRAYNSIGFFNANELKDAYESGKFRNGDYARYDDSAEWRPIEIVISELASSPKHADSPEHTNNGDSAKEPAASKKPAARKKKTKNT